MCVAIFWWQINPKHATAATLLWHVSSLAWTDWWWWLRWCNRRSYSKRKEDELLQCAIYERPTKEPSKSIKLSLCTWTVVRDELSHPRNAGRCDASVQHFSATPAARHEFSESENTFETALMKLQLPKWESGGSQVTVITSESTCKPFFSPFHCSRSSTELALWQK